MDTIIIPIPEGADWETITVKYVNPRYRKAVKEEQSNPLFEDAVITHKE